MPSLSAVLLAPVFALCLGVLTSPVLADPMPVATGEVILTVDGNLGPDAPEGGYALDIEGLKTLPSISFDTSTIWTDGVQTFQGVSLKQFLALSGATEGILTVEALNGYLVEMPISDLEDDAPIIAYHIDGKEFSRREKGPLWLVYPYDRDEKYKSELTYANSVWQVQKLTVE